MASGDCSAFLISADSLLTTGLGVLAGARACTEGTKIMSLTPSSAKVGTPGTWGERSGLATAKSLTRPVAICGATDW